MVRTWYPAIQKEENGIMDDLLSCSSVCDDRCWKVERQIMHDVSAV